MSIRDMLRGAGRTLPAPPVSTVHHETTKHWADEVVAVLDEPQRWALRQALAQPARFYGADGTIHSTTSLDVVTDNSGKVIEVWFRCQMLPFRQSLRNAHDPDHGGWELPALVGVEVVDPPSPTIGGATT